MTLISLSLDGVGFAHSKTLDEYISSIQASTKSIKNTEMLSWKFHDLDRKVIQQAGVQVTLSLWLRQHYSELGQHTYTHTYTIKKTE